MSPPPRIPRTAGRRSARGVTLVELIAVLVIIGVIASVGARMMARPIGASLASGDMMQLADQAAQATRRLGEDLQRALPNSVRITAGAGGAMHLELIPVQSVGRYRIRAAATGTAGDPLDFETVSDDRFDVLGPLPTVDAGAQLVIHNLGTAEGNAYAGNNRRAGVALAGSVLSFTPNNAFPSSSPSGRFSLVTTAVTWVCAPGTGTTGTLTRVDGYAIQSAQPADLAAAPLASANRVVVARGVTDCAFTQDVAQANIGLVGARIGLGLNDAQARLAQQYVVDNTP